MRAPAPVRRALYEAKTIVAQHPGLAMPIARRRHGEPVRADTELVIEGFPRTGTSFAVAAFHMAQRRAVSVACHVHAPAQVIKAVRSGIPALVVVREPEETVLSFLIRNPHIGLSQALRGYLRFYGPLVRYREGFVGADFRDVTADFGAVTRKLNERFGTAFGEFEHTEENVKACFAEIDGDYRQRVAGAAFEQSVARPSKVRDEMKDALRGRYREGAPPELRGRAERVYAALLSSDHAGNR